MLHTLGHWTINHMPPPQKNKSKIKHNLLLKTYIRELAFLIEKRDHLTEQSYRYSLFASSACYNRQTSFILGCLFCTV